MSSAHYDQIADEISHGTIDRGLWMEAFAASAGDEQAAKARYIKLRVRKLREKPVRRRHAQGNRQAGVLAWLLDAGERVATDLWTAWLWAWTFAFAALTGVGVLCLGTMLYLKLCDDGVLAWPFFTVGCAFMTCFLFGRGVQCLDTRPPTTLFYVVEILALCAAIWPLSHLMNPVLLGHIPRALSSELVFLVVRFLNSGDVLANALSVAVFFLPLYGVIAYVRQKKI